MLDIAVIPLETLIKQFVQASDALSGIYDPEAEEEIEDDNKNHLSLVKIAASACQPVPVILLNAALTNKKKKFLRTGTEASRRQLNPPSGEVLERLLTELDEEIARLWREQHSLGTAEQKARIAWDIHNRLVCMYPFRSRNERTARLVLVMVRRLIGLPFEVLIDDANAVGYEKRIVHYQKEIFLPEMKARGIL